MNVASVGSCLLLLGAAVLGGVATASAPDAQRAMADAQRATAEVIVTFASEGERNATAITALGGRVTGGREVSVVPVLFAHLPTEAIPALEGHPDVTSVVRNREVRLAGVTSTDAGTVPWGVSRVGGRSAASRVDADARSNVTVAVLDTGIDYDHPDLADAVAWGVDTVGPGIQNGTDAADDSNGHGTHVAGTVAALENGAGVVGVAPGARLYAIQVLNRTGSGTYEGLIEGIDQAIKGPDGRLGTDDDADVLVMSLAGDSESEQLESAVKQASQYAILVAAAGNEGGADANATTVTVPARYEEVIAVAATNRSDGTSSFSSEGPSVELAAPGVRINSTAPGGTYDVKSGTSMAAPHVAAAAALVVAGDRMDGERALSNAEVRTLLRDTAVDIDAPGVDNTSGYGLLQADAAVGSVVVSLTLTANATTTTTDRPIRFRVSRRDTGEAVNATLTLGETVRHTGADGTLRHAFDSPGEVVVTASKDGASELTFRKDSLTVKIDDSDGPGDVTGNGRPARDPDDDGRYEDVDGDGDADFDDAVALAFHTEEVSAAFFDFDGDGDVDFDDAVELAFQT